MRFCNASKERSLETNVGLNSIHCEGLGWPVEMSGPPVGNRWLDDYFLNCLGPFHRAPGPDFGKKPPVSLSRRDIASDIGTTFAA